MSKSVRVSILLPAELWADVCRLIPSGQRSKLIAVALEQELRWLRQRQALDRASALQEEFRARYGVMPKSAEEVQEMRQERDAKLTGLR